MKKSEETAKQMHIMTLDMVSAVKGLHMPIITGDGTVEEKTQACLEFAKAITNISHLCQDIAWTAETLRNAVFYEEWNKVLEPATEGE